jgi:hypothetical protein
LPWRDSPEIHALNQWTNLEVDLGDGRVEIDNNLAGRDSPDQA